MSGTEETTGTREAWEQEQPGEQRTDEATSRAVDDVESPESADESGDATDRDDHSDDQDEGSSEGGTRQPGADPEDKEEIEAERQERLDPDNRPENVEVDNTDREFDVEKGMFTDSEGYEETEPKFPGIGEQGA